MADYINKNCPRCGGYIRLLTAGEVCEKCGYNLRSVDSPSTSACENKICPICQKPLSEQLDGSFKCDNCGYTEATQYTNEEIRKILAEQSKQVSTDYSKLNNAPGLYGWICPKCGAVMSPFTSFCPNCTQRNFELTCTTTNSTAQPTFKSNFDVNNFIGGRKDKLGYE